MTTAYWNLVGGLAVILGAMLVVYFGLNAESDKGTKKGGGKCRTK